VGWEDFQQHASCARIKLAGRGQLPQRSAQSMADLSDTGLQRSVASQTDFQEPDEATLRNELAMAAYLEILSVLDDERQPVYHDLGEAYANKVLLLAAADEEDRQTEAADEAGDAALAAEAESQTPQPQQPPELQRLESLESQVIESEWSLRCKLAQVRESTKHPVQRWLEGATASQAASPFASLAPSIRSGQQPHQPHQRHPSTSCGSRPSSVAGLSEVFVSDSEEDDEEGSIGQEAAEGGADSKSEMTFYNCAVHGVEVPESFVRVKFKGGGGAGEAPAAGK
ncbi:hypothetical protein BOX15_Mlig022639g1, partial [Macrostomum lignano]